MDLKVKGLTVPIVGNYYQNTEARNIHDTKLLRGDMFMLEFDIKNKYDVNAIGVFYLPSDKSNQKILLGHVDRSTAKSIRGIFDMVTGSREKFRMTGVLQSVPNATSRAMVKITGVIMNKER